MGSNTLMILVVTILGTVLKLLGYVTLSWGWVLSPIWVPFLVFNFLLWMSGLLSFLNHSGEKAREKQRQKVLTEAVNHVLSTPCCRDSKGVH